MNLAKKLSALTFLLITGCTTSSNSHAFSGEIEPPFEIMNLEPGQNFVLSGYLSYSGEFMFFLSNEARRLNLVYPYCISGAGEFDVDRIPQLDNRKVTITGSVHTVENHPPSSQESEVDIYSISTSVTVNNKVIKNFCLGNKALIISNIDFQ